MPLDPVRCARIKVLGLDVDGVLTDNAVYIGGEGIESKRFDIQDGLGHALMREAGIEIVWVSGRHSDATLARGRELKVRTVLQIAPDGKVPAIDALLAKRGLDWSEFAFVGDDLADLPVLARAGLAIAVANATDLVKARAHHVTTRHGGHGAVREVIDALLHATGKFEQGAARYLRQAVVP
ncbi:MAG TPA: HAD hydrolase family protein [Gemmatimonadales bacterium]|nr:HAD hydrolase family protein [Gemmatimonadales bacterium]